MDAHTGQPVGQPLHGHIGHVYSVAYSPNGAYIVSGSWDKTIRIWDAHTGRPVGQPLNGHAHYVTSVAYSPNGAYIVSGSRDNTIRIWDARQREMLAPPAGVSSVDSVPSSASKHPLSHPVRPLSPLSGAFIGTIMVHDSHGDLTTTAKTQKKTGKGRLDKYYKLAKEQGYRARSAFKLIQLNKKYSFLESARCCIDLCAAPGGWLQVASKTMPLNSLIVGVDLVPIRPIPRVVTFAQDITTSACRAQLRSELTDWKADVVLHDGAPNVGSAWIQDAYSQMPGGTFVTRVFRSVDYNNLIWVFNQLFGKVEATKPPSSRNVSAEIFVVCQGFLAPQHIDPKFLDPKHVFKDLSELPPVPSTSRVQPGSKAHNNVFMPEKKRRAREGYADGDYALFYALPAAEFVRAHDAVLVLGTANQISFTTPEEKEWLMLEATTPDLIANCDDLKVLGKGDFKKLLKWRTAIREELGLESKQKPLEDVTETVEVMEVDEDQQIEAELTRLNADAAARAKRDRRKANERRTRTVMRMQLQMTAPLDIGMEFTDNALKGDVFDLSGVDGRAIAEKNEDSSDEEGKEGKEGKAGDDNKGESSDDNEDGEKKVAGLEDELDGLYEQYRERMAERDLKFKAKESRQKDKSREEWSGIRKGDNEDEEESGEESGEGGWDAAQAAKDRGDEGESSSDEDEGERPAAKRRKVGDKKEKARLITRLEEPKQKGAASKAAQDVANVEDEDEEGDIHEDVEMASESDGVDVPESAEGEEDEDDFEIGYIKKYGLLTPEAVTLAQQLVNRKTTKTHLINDGFTRYSLNSQDSLPSWFLDDERKHYKPNLPITKEAVAALRAKQRALDARPIKKVAEAKARKKLRAQQRLEKAMSKAEGVVATGGMTEKEKAAQIEKVMRKGMASAGKQRKEVKVVVAKGVNKGVKGRPKGVKGRYAMVDARMRKEVRAKKRKEKANKERRKN
ncbi:AdoMet-dependent rRNA methyltransferase spb1 [Ceratobasidium sp. 370]|nr:AdoMet-dependent rRNA methyltransferase spb1 [Ceratobasidium sp. 370]